jgi:hypothetical protein
MIFRNLLLIPALVPAFASAAVVTTPYLNDFSSYGSAASNATVTSDTDFSEFNGQYMFVVSRVSNDASSNVLRARNGTNGVGYASIQSDKTGGLDFTISTKVSAYELDTTGVDTSGTNNATTMAFSLVAAGSAGNYSSFSTANYRLAIDWITNSVQLLRAGTSVGTATGTLPSFALNAQLSFSLGAVYTTGTTADLTASVSDGTNTYAISFTDNAAYTGNYFGVRTSKDGSTNGTSPNNSTAIGVYLDDFALNVVPEPSAALLAVSAAGFLAARRSRRDLRP